MKFPHSQLNKNGRVKAAIKLDKREFITRSFYEETFAEIASNSFQEHHYHKLTQPLDKVNDQTASIRSTISLEFILAAID